MYNLILMGLPANQDEDEFIHNITWSHDSLHDKLLSRDPII